jgi:hypothetical protein
MTDDPPHGATVDWSFSVIPETIRKRNAANRLLDAAPFRVCRLNSTCVSFCET